MKKQNQFLMYGSSNITSRQKAKEKAVYIALKNNMGLIRRGKRVYGICKDGSLKFVSESDTYETLWQDALDVLLENERETYMIEVNVLVDYDYKNHEVIKAIENLGLKVTYEMKNLGVLFVLTSKERMNELLNLDGVLEAVIHREINLAPHNNSIQ